MYVFDTGVIKVSLIGLPPRLVRPGDATVLAGEATCPICSGECDVLAAEDRCPNCPGDCDGSLQSVAGDCFFGDTVDTFAWG